MTKKIVTIPLKLYCEGKKKKKKKINKQSYKTLKYLIYYQICKKRRSEICCLKFKDFSKKLWKFIASQKEKKYI